MWVDFHNQCYWIRRLASCQHILFQNNIIHLSTATSTEKDPQAFFPFCRSCNVYNPSNTSIHNANGSLLALASFWSAVNNRFIKNKYWAQKYYMSRSHLPSSEKFRIGASNFSWACFKSLYIDWDHFSNFRFFTLPAPVARALIKIEFLRLIQCKKCWY